MKISEKTKQITMQFLPFKSCFKSNKNNLDNSGEIKLSKVPECKT